MSKNPKINIDVKLLLQSSSKRIIIEFFDISSQDEAYLTEDSQDIFSDKFQQSKIGRTEITLDEILQFSLNNN